MADTATTAREVYSVEVVPNGTRGGAHVWVNGECAGRIAVPFWGEADDPDHRLFIASVPDAGTLHGERPAGTAAGMSYDEARAAVIAAWRTAPAPEAVPEAVEVAPADHAEAARLAAIAAVDVAITSAVAAGTAPTLIADMRKARALI